MPEINFDIILLSDAEPGSGLGTEIINDLVPKYHDDRPFIPASHVKGLMKDNLLNIAKDLENGDLEKSKLAKLVKKVFGTKGGINNSSVFSLTDARIKDSHSSEIDKDNSSVFSLSDSRIEGKADFLLVTRTSLNQYGVAEDTFLRTTEAIPVGTKFKGTLRFYDNPEIHVDLLLRLALLSLNVIGGNRNRGCGACKVIIENESRTPGTVLKELFTCSLDEQTLYTDTQPAFHNPGNTDNTVFVKLMFTADGPVCLPEIPIVGNNAIKTGFSIPASAVQGTILNRLNKISTDLADYCFAHPKFRCWPLLPTIPECTGIPVRTPTTHRISKIPSKEGNYDFRDHIIAPYDLKDIERGAPLKSADGVLVPTQNRITFWRSGSMAKLITAHAVHGKERNLFTVESMALPDFSGIVSMPECAFKELEHSLKTDSFVQFGKARSVRGGGKLKVSKIDIADLFKQNRLPTGFDNRIFIVQSPLQIPDDWEKETAGEILKKLVEQSGWGEIEEKSASMTVMFGWNRHGIGVQSGENGRLRAKKVITPGSVFLLKKPIENLQQALVSGIGEGKELGYGAVLPHPGIASHPPQDVQQKENSIDSSSTAGKLGFDLWYKSKDSGLSASQIGFFRGKLEKNKQSALNYLDDIVKDRNMIKDRWKDVFRDLKSEIEKNHEATLSALKVWHDLVVAEGVQA